MLKKELNIIMVLSLVLLSVPFCFAHSLIFYETFDNQTAILDNSGVFSGYYGDVDPTPFFIAGVKDNAANLSRYKKICYPSFKNLNSTNGTIQFLMKTNSTSGGLFELNQFSYINSLMIFKNFDTVLFMETKNNQGSYSQASVHHTSNNWHLVSVIYEQKTADTLSFKVCADKRCSNTHTVTNTTLNTSDSFCVGWNKYYGYSNALFDELKLYDYVKSDTQIIQDYISYLGVCSDKTDCGTDGLSGNTFCQSNNVYKNYITYTCNNIGSSNSYCSNTSSPQLVEECLNGCTTGLCNLPPVKNISTGNVKVIGRDLIVDGKIYTVKSLGYGPVPIGQSADWGYDITKHPELRARDFPLIRQMNANTIRTWGKVGQTSFLDDAWNNGTKPIRVIMGYWMGSEKDYTNVTVRNAIKADFNSYVQAYKNHPAVLVWAIGNEENHFYGTNNARHAAYFSLVNEMAQNAYAIEGANYHPVMAIALEFPNQMDTVGNSAGGSNDSSIPYVDMWGINHYPGASFGNFFNTYVTKTSKPLIITEYGIDAFNNSALSEYESVQASWDVNLWREIDSSIAVGGSIMEYCDEWWKSGDVSSHNNGGYPTTSHPDGFSNEEWWGIVRTVNNTPGSMDIMQPRQAYYALANEFNDECIGDANNDLTVNDKDASIVGANWQKVCNSISCGDFNNDGYTNDKDAAIMAAHWGIVCENTTYYFPEMSASTGTSSQENTENKKDTKENKNIIGPVKKQDKDTRKPIVPVPKQVAKQPAPAPQVQKEKNMINLSPPKKNIILLNSKKKK
jgi:hypothetical protein